MSGWIDADAIKNKAWKAESEACFYALEDVVSVTDIDEAPSIDIIRCGECKHWERLNYEAPKEGWCDDQMPYSDGRWVDADDFCSYGEREGE